MTNSHSQLNQSGTNNMLILRCEHEDQNTFIGRNANTKG